MALDRLLQRGGYSRSQRESVVEHVTDHPRPHRQDRRTKELRMRPSTRRTILGAFMLLLASVSVAQPRAASAQLPPLGQFTDYLLVGMKPSSNGEAITIGSSNEIGADRAVTTSNNNYGLQHP